MLTAAPKASLPEPEIKFNGTLVLGGAAMMVAGTAAVFGGIALNDEWEGRGDPLFNPKLGADLLIGVGTLSAGGGVPVFLTGVLSAFVPRMSSGPRFGGTLAGVMGLESLAGGAFWIHRGLDRRQSAVVVVGSAFIIAGTALLASGVAVIVSDERSRKARPPATPALFTRPVLSVGLASATLGWTF